VDGREARRRGGEGRGGGVVPNGRRVRSLGVTADRHIGDPAGWRVTAPTRPNAGPLPGPVRTHGRGRRPSAFPNRRPAPRSSGPASPNRTEPADVVHVGDIEPCSKPVATADVVPTNSGTASAPTNPAVNPPTRRPRKRASDAIGTRAGEAPLTRRGRDELRPDVSHDILNVGTGQKNCVRSDPTRPDPVRRGRSGGRDALRRTPDPGVRTHAGPPARSRRRRRRSPRGPSAVPSPASRRPRGRIYGRRR